MDREEVLLAVLEADEDFIEEILTAATKRKQVLHPDWEIRYLALPRDAAGEQRLRYERAWRVLTERRVSVMTPPCNAEIWIHLPLKMIYRRLHEKKRLDL